MATNKKQGRSKNHTGHTYELNGRYRTVIRYKGRTVTAMGDTKTESNRAAQLKLKALPEAIHMLDKDATNIKLNEFLPAWLENKHKNKRNFLTTRRGIMGAIVITSLVWLIILVGTIGYLYSNGSTIKWTKQTCGHGY